MKKNTQSPIRLSLLCLVVGVFLLWACRPGGGSDGTIKTIGELEFPPSPVALMEQAQQLATIP